MGRGLWQPVLSLTKPQLLKPLQLPQCCQGTWVKCSYRAPHTCSPDTDPTAPTTEWNRDDEVFREGKGTMHWIQDRNILVQLSLLVEWGPRISAEDQFHQLSIKLALLLLPAPDFYGKDTTQRAHSSRLLGLHAALHVRIPGTAANLNTHSPCLQAITCLPSLKAGEEKRTSRISMWIAKLQLTKQL